MQRYHSALWEPLRLSRLYPRLLAQQRLMSTSGLPRSPPLQQITSVEDTQTARAWIQDFNKCAIPKSAVELSFSRSSGPGGQNVNKVNTKATIRCSVNSAWMPEWAKAVLRRHPTYSHATGSLIVSSEVTRSQSQNLDEGLRKLHAIILAAAQADIKNETSQETVDRVRGHARAQDARRRAEKEFRSATKSRRRGDFGGF
ncbi:RF-1 domain-containing protein [Auriculariales sp. MPI-PUGE-AT-0066]|nr:RF-1 domain-containing protein [Auriculariales sp. MPI-PUGE-AT-0066]